MAWIVMLGETTFEFVGLTNVPFARSKAFNYVNKKTQSPRVGLEPTT